MPRLQLLKQTFFPSKSSAHVRIYKEKLFLLSKVRFSTSNKKPAPLDASIGCEHVEVCP